MNQDPMIGRQLAHYRIDRFIGRGGMASVYVATDTKLDKTVALKMIDARNQGNASYARRFVQEAKSIAKWRHERIVEIYDAGEEDGIYYYVMEYIHGADLRQVLKNTRDEGRLLPFANVIRIGKAFAEALDYIHSKGIIHRDVKPANIMLAQDKRIILTDFGLAMDLAEGDERLVISSPWYTAPEQSHQSGAATPLSDIYSLGVILYEMLVGQVPFDDPSPTSVAIQHLTQPPPTPSELNPALNSALDNVLLKALSKQPEDRYPTGAELMEAITYTLRGISLQTDDLQGTELDEYRLGELLGKGGMARVYRGVDVNLRRNVAVKVIDFSHHGDEEYTDRFFREAQAIAQLEHPNIVRLYRYGEDGGMFYMAMQYIEGSDLQTRLAYYRQKGEAFPREDASQIIRGVCGALDYAHEKGIIHRDVKPSNVMLDKNGHAYLTDFGLAMLANRETKGEIFGSPLYIAPEQAMSSASVVPQSDLYAVGVILYEMFTGQVPFSNQNPLVLAMQHMSEKPKAPREIKETIDPELETVILRAMAKEPEQRFQTGAELSNALDNALSVDDLPQLMTMPAAPSIPDAAASSRKLDLPPMPAAVVMTPSQAQAAASAPVAAKEQRGSMGCFIGFVTVLLIIAASIITIAVLIVQATPEMIKETVDEVETRYPQVVVEASELLNIETEEPPTAMMTVTAVSSPTPTPSATGTTAVPTPTTQSETSEAIVVPPDDASVTMTATPESTSTTTATPGPTTLPTNTPTVTPTFTPTPLIIVTREQDGMPMVLIPDSSFIMGGPVGSEDDYLDEYSRHRVNLDGYYMDLYEVSVAQYAAFLTDIGRYVNACDGWTCLDTQFETRFSRLTNNVTGGYLAVPGFENYPINNVSWYGAKVYCEWVDGRLPTEAEWEFAARGNEDSLYPWGNDLPDETRAVFAAISFNELQPVDSLPDGVSPFGIYHMAGNVWEWTLDGYDPIYYDRIPEPVENPVAPATNSRSARVIRGGGYNSSAEDLRTSNRDSEGANIRDNPNMGFRCVVPVPVEEE